MANLQFLRGTQAKLNDIKNKVAGAASVQDGAFYLTTDTSRLYVGQGSDLVELNKSVTTVKELTDLPKNIRNASGEVTVRVVEDGQFYYVSDINVLCVYSEKINGTTGKKEDSWTQINPNTRLTGVSDSAETLVPGEDFDSGIRLTKTFSQAQSGGDLPEVTNTNYIKTKNLKVEAIENTDGDFEAILLTADTYNIGTNQVKKTGTETDDEKKVSLDLIRTIASEEDDDKKISKDTIVIVGDEGIQSITSNEDNQITIKATTIDYMDNAGKNGIVTITTQEKEGGNTHSTSLKPVVRYGKETETVNVTKQNVDAQGNLLFKDDGSRDTETSEVTRQKNSEVFDFFNDGSTNTYEINLDVYTIQEVDSIKDNLESDIKAHIRANNAMTFKGTIDTFVSIEGSLPKESDKVSAGDVYMLAISNPVVYDGVTYKPGDFFIATGTENAETGLIENNTLAWKFVPAGNDTYITSYNSTTKAFEIVDGQNSSNTIGSINVKASGNVEVTPKNSGSANSAKVEYEITHKALTPAIKENHNKPTTSTQQAAGTGVDNQVKTSSFTTVDALTVDGDGHVTGWNSQTVTVTDTHNRLDSNASELTITSPEAGSTEANKKAIISSKIQMTDEDYITQTYDIKTSAKNINISGGAASSQKSIEFSLVWGEF